MFYIGTLVNISSIIEDIRRCYEGQSYFYMKSINVCREHLWGDDWYEVGGNSSRCVDCRHFVINPTANDFKVSSLYLIILYYLCWILMAQHCQDLLVTQGMIQSQPITEVFFLMMHTAHTVHTAHTAYTTHRTHQTIHNARDTKNAGDTNTPPPTIAAPATYS